MSDALFVRRPFLVNTDDGFTTSRSMMYAIDLPGGAAVCEHCHKTPEEAARCYTDTLCERMVADWTTFPSGQDSG